MLNLTNKGVFKLLFCIDIQVVHRKYYHFGGISF